jgi:hypothetical protein
LVNPYSHGLVAAFHVQSNSSYTLEQIPDGTYQVLFELGLGWNPQTQGFSQNKSFARFDELLEYTTVQFGNQIQYRAFEVTLHTVLDGNASTSNVSEQEFKSY